LFSRSAGEPDPSTDPRAVRPGPPTMEIPLVEGRPFTAGEVNDGRDVVLVSDGLAEGSYSMPLMLRGARTGRRAPL